MWPSPRLQDINTHTFVDRNSVHNIKSSSSQNEFANVYITISQNVVPRPAVIVSAGNPEGLEMELMKPCVYKPSGASSVHSSVQSLLTHSCLSKL